MYNIIVSVASSLEFGRTYYNYNSRFLFCRSQILGSGGVLSMVKRQCSEVDFRWVVEADEGVGKEMKVVTSRWCGGRRVLGGSLFITFVFVRYERLISYCQPREPRDPRRFVGRRWWVDAGRFVPETVLETREIAMSGSDVGGIVFLFSYPYANTSFWKREKRNASRMKKKMIKCIKHSRYIRHYVIVSFFSTKFLNPFLYQNIIYIT